ncbi:MAG: hypothetical protein JNM07_06285 [Phycisphaerae bacterium]|nr:hypothetical protein [Phycisphaerae bacterium]
MNRTAVQGNPGSGRRRIGALLLIAALLGLLLWARLVIVTGHPRTAIAEPDRSVGKSTLKK